MYTKGNNRNQKILFDYKLFVQYRLLYWPFRRVDGGAIVDNGPFINTLVSVVTYGWTPVLGVLN